MSYKLHSECGRLDGPFSTPIAAPGAPACGAFERDRKITVMTYVTTGMIAIYPFVAYSALTGYVLGCGRIDVPLSMPIAAPGTRACRAFEHDRDITIMTYVTTNIIAACPPVAHSANAEA
jgi:hypothetical protein